MTETRRTYRHVVVDVAIAAHRSLSTGANDPVFPYDGELRRAMDPNKVIAQHLLRADAVHYLLAAADAQETAYWSVDKRQRILDICVRAALDPVYARSDNYLLAGRSGVVPIDKLDGHKKRLADAEDAILRSVQRHARHWSFSRTPVVFSRQVSRASGFYMLDLLNDPAARLYHNPVTDSWHREVDFDGQCIAPSFAERRHQAG